MGAMSPDDAFLQAVLERPDDDGPRLMYADWLAERGDVRGEFIHLQLRLARTPPDDPDRDALLARCDALLAAGRPVWLAALAPLGVAEEEVVFRRGFVDEVKLRRPVVFLDRADELFAAAP